MRMKAYKNSTNYKSPASLRGLYELHTKVLRIAYEGSTNYKLPTKAYETSTKAYDSSKMCSFFSFSLFIILIYLISYL